MGWWKLKLDVSQSQRVTDTLHALADSLQGAEVDEFLTELSGESGPICAFFRSMFDSEGPQWEPNDPMYKAYKAHKYGESRVGHRTKELRRSLTSSSPFSIRKVSGGTLTFGSAVRDTESKRHQPYAGYFNNIRPVIDQQTLERLRTYLKTGEGKAAFDALASRLKARLLEKVIK